LHSILAPLIAAENTEHWLHALDAIGVPVSAIQDFPTVAEEPQLAHRGVIVDIAHHQEPEQSVKIVRASHVAEPGSPTIQGPSPTLGAHSQEILEELGYSAQEIGTMRDAGMI
jgi:crotonobetainyl-CoA:carnitine CoA-transferase CaiB-like acyl-CoA transferase